MTTISPNPTFRFLVVDDSRAIQSIIGRALQACGYPNLEIRTANDGEAAMLVLEEFTPNLIITDWHMPKISGLEFCQQVRQLYEGKIPIGFVTTESSQEKLDTARRYGASFIINKPFEDEDFRKAVLSVVSLESTPETPNPTPSSTLYIDSSVFKASLKSVIGVSHFDLSPCAPIGLTQLTESNLIGLYGFSGKPLPVAGVAIMEMHAVGLLWALSHNQPFSAVQSLVAAKSHQDAELLAARNFMDKISQGISVSTNKEPLALTRSSIVNRQFPRLEMAFKTNAGRADFKLTVPNYGEGLISFVLLQES